MRCVRCGRKLDDFVSFVTCYKCYFLFLDNGGKKSLIAVLEQHNRTSNDVIRYENIADYMLNVIHSDKFKAKK